MNFASLKSATPRFSRSAVALALVAFGASASALPMFSVDGDNLANIAQPRFDADNILISDFARVLINGNTFTETGYLSITDFQLGGATVQNTGLGTQYGMYVQFTGTGTLSVNGNPSMTPTFGSFQTLTYQLFGYDGPTATFSVGPGGATENATGEVLLASGSLIGGTVSTVPGPSDNNPATDDKFTPSASALLTFSLTEAGKGVFVAPSPFYEMAFASFTNTPSQVMMFDGGFTISQGGGAINFTTAIPEPETYALMLAGLAAVGFVARRRRPQA